MASNVKPDELATLREENARLVALLEAECIDYGNPLRPPKKQKHKQPRAFPAETPPEPAPMLVFTFFSRCVA